ncbi:TraB/GumN family protein [Stenotrophomonas maltophilia group sp. P373]|uniref:Uncharacterized protein n=1 Tax=Stenotrophomonas sepilia TaxID=2860290 RepID=A0ABQ6QH45_9GAMM|nr:MULTISPECIES: TraB/GumN family protein [Stenotrophomonas]MCU1006399.1 TraB/GumN family protein [Stenotrophomonas maltophilia]GMR29492.1 hypothetical protein STENOSP10_37140 [Stenotrophomonas sepilia]
MSAARQPRSLLSVSLDVSVHRTLAGAPASGSRGTKVTDALPPPTIRAEGPALWQARREEAHLWILPVPTALPGSMRCVTGEAGRIAAVAHTILGRPKVDITGRWEGSGLSALFTLARAVSEAETIHHNPDNLTLKDVLPADVHAEWQAALNECGIDPIELERLRPHFAARALRKAVMARHQLESPKAFCKELRRIGRAGGARYFVPRTELAIDIAAADDCGKPHPALDDTTRFAVQVERLRRLHHTARVQSKAWAQGDALGMCGHDVPMDMHVTATGSNELDTLRREAWLSAVETVTAGRSTTLAMLDIADAFDGNGYIRALRERGFSFQPA